MTSKHLLNAGKARVSRRALLRGGLASAAGVLAAALANPWNSLAGHAPAPLGRAFGARPALGSGQASPPRWIALATSAARPAARRDHSLTFDADRGLLYLFGGRAQGVALDDLWTFDLATAAWSEASLAGAKPPARFGHNAFYDAVQRRLVVAMGQAGSTFFNDVWAFDPATLSWVERGAGSGERPAVRYGAGGAYDPGGNRFLVSHGFTDNGRFDDTWVFDLATEAWSQIGTSGGVPLKRCLTRAVWETSSQQLLLFGGQSDENPFLGDFWSLDVARGVWTQKQAATLPGPRNLYGAAADPSGQHWYFFGGSTPDGMAADTWGYDMLQDAWSRIEGFDGPDIPLARSGPDIAAIGNSLYLFGGNHGGADLDDAWVLQLNGA
jgi:hypothetical protein